MTTGGPNPGDLSLSSPPEVLVDTTAGATLDLVFDMVVQ
jgi:hypothetical protein